MLPAVALLAAAAVDSFTRFPAEHRLTAISVFLPAAVFWCAFAYALWVQADIFFQKDAVSVCRQIYEGDPFREALQLANYISSHTASTARIAVLGSEPEIYFYSHRHSATGYIYGFALWEDQPYASRMQHEMFAEVEAARPEYVVAQPGWFLYRSRGQEERFAWMGGYLNGNYELTGVAERLSSDRTEFHWGRDAAAQFDWKRDFAIPGKASVLFYIFQKYAASPQSTHH